MSKHVVATVAEIPPGQRKLVTIRGRQIAVFNLDGEFFGLFNRCPHQGGPMCEGILTGLIESDQPGDTAIHGRGRFCAVRGMAGNSMSALARASATRRRSACAAIRLRWRRGSAWCRDLMWPRPFRSLWKSTMSWWRCRRDGGRRSDGGQAAFHVRKEMLHRRRFQVFHLRLLIEAAQLNCRGGLREGVERCDLGQ